MNTEFRHAQAPTEHSLTYYKEMERDGIMGIIILEYL
jgi:hypothetical protein